MGKIRIHDYKKAEWKVMRAIASPNRREGVSDLELDSSVLFHEAGNERSPCLFELNYLPGVVIDTHAHEEDEIIYIVGGDMQIGARSLGAGSSLFVASKTFYGFAAGPNGLRMLVFHPRQDYSNIPKDKIGTI